MSHLAIVVAGTVAMWPAGSTLNSTTLKTIAHKVNFSQTLIAQKYGGADPHGADPHGDDPHDEVHDSGLKSNEDEKARKAPKDVYGGTVPNTQQPYYPW